MGWGEAAETTTTTQIFVIPFHTRATRHFMAERKIRRAFWCKKVSGICKILLFYQRTHTHTHTYLQSSQRKYFLLFLFFEKKSLPKQTFPISTQESVFLLASGCDCVRRSDDFSASGSRKNSSVLSVLSRVSSGMGDVCVERIEFSLSLAGCATVS